MRRSADLREKMCHKCYVTCVRYEINLASPNFGECMCGAAKADHTAAALAAGEGAKAAVVVDSAEVRARFVQRECAVCDEYRADITAVTLGDCVCGRPRAEHSAAALSASVAKTKGFGTTRQDSAEVRAKLVQHANFCGCARYEVKVGAHDAYASFDTCVCGEPRSRHSPDALEAAAVISEKRKARASAEVRKGFAKRAAWDERECVDCERFELDLDPSAPFGQCVCGQPKAKHTDAAMAR